jgi:hypothetical protein
MHVQNFLTLGAFLAPTVLGRPATSNDGAQKWEPANGQSYQIILHGVLDVSSSIVPNVDIFDIDLFYHSADTIKTLHNQGKKVICYFSAGTCEDWRPDWSDFKASDKGSCLPEWSGESWLDIRSDNVWQIMQKRIQLAGQKGCDGIDPDNMGKVSPVLFISFLTFSDRWLWQQ